MLTALFAHIRGLHTPAQDHNIHVYTTRAWGSRWKGGCHTFHEMVMDSEASVALESVLVDDYDLLNLLTVDITLKSFSRWGWSAFFLSSIVTGRQQAESCLHCPPHASTLPLKTSPVRPAMAVSRCCLEHSSGCTSGDIQAQRGHINLGARFSTNTDPKSACLRASGEDATSIKSIVPVRYSGTLNHQCTCSSDSAPNSTRRNC